jgi:hypothetical protein
MLKSIPVLLLAFISFGCVSLPLLSEPPQKPYRDDAITIFKDSVNNMPSSIVWNDFGTYRAGTEEWREEANKRFNNPILFHCHGGIHMETYEENGKTVVVEEWWVYPDPPRKPMPAAELARSLANLYPDRDIVLLTCNPGGFDLNVKRVWYTKRNVWTIPDAYATGFYAHEQIRDYDAVGSIWEFVSTNGRYFGAKFPVTETPTTKPTTRPTTRPAVAPHAKPSTRPAVPATQPTTRPVTQPTTRPVKFTRDEIVPLRVPTNSARR